MYLTQVLKNNVLIYIIYVLGLEGCNKNIFARLFVLLRPKNRSIEIQVKILKIQRQGQTTHCFLVTYCNLVHIHICMLPLPLSLWRSKVLCCWLASLPVQLSQLGHRNPALSARLILSIHAAASRGNKDLLNSLQTHACRLYGTRTQLKRKKRNNQIKAETST